MKNIYTGIDIGTRNVKVVVARQDTASDLPIKIIGTGSSVSNGMRHGYIVNTKEVSTSIREAVKKASENSGVQIRSARIAVGGIGTDELNATGEVSLTASGGEVRNSDIDRATNDSERKSSAKLINKKIIHAIPIRYRIDNNPVIGRPVGLRGSKLSVDTLLITYLEQHLNDMVEAVEDAGIEVEDVMASSLAASLVTLTKPQKKAGVVLANIGAETVSIVVFEDDTPISLKIFPKGTSDITNKIAIKLRVPLTEAEQMKKGAITKTDASRKRIDNIITSQLKDTFNLIDAHLKSIGKQRLLPAGIVITGGGSGIATARDVARATMQLPSQVGILSTGTRPASIDATWAVAFGLCKWGYSTNRKKSSSGLGGVLPEIFQSLRKALKSMLP